MPDKLLQDIYKGTEYTLPVLMFNYGMLSMGSRVFHLQRCHIFGKTPTVKVEHPCIHSQNPSILAIQTVQELGARGEENT